MQEKTTNSWRLALDLGPLLAFFITYKIKGLMAATAVLIALTLVSLAITYFREKKLALMPLVTAVVVAVFGGLTLYLQSDYFIKIKPTIVNLLFASFLLGGHMLGKPTLKILLGGAMPISDTGWKILNVRWGIFFVFLALLNEIIWRHFSTDFWVNFKVFGMFTCTLLFTFSQLPLIQTYWQHNTDETPKA